MTFFWWWLSFCQAVYNTIKLMWNLYIHDCYLCVCMPVCVQVDLLIQGFLFLSSHENIQHMTITEFKNMTKKGCQIIKILMKFIIIFSFCRRWEQQTGRHLTSMEDSSLLLQIVRGFQNMAQVFTASTQLFMNSTCWHKPLSHSRTSSLTGDTLY